MIFEIVVYKVAGNKRTRLYANQVSARDAVVALERSFVRFAPDREVMIWQIDRSIERPPISRVARDGA
jgi:hypothetical protein